MRAFAFDRTWSFGVGPDELWSILTATESYPRWWPWLEELSVTGLHVGAVAHLRISTPLAYRLRLTATVGRVEPARQVRATVGGDLAGPARLELAGVAGGSTARLAWSLEPSRPLLVAGGRIARPALVWAHDRVVAAGIRQFRQAALRDRPGVRGGGGAGP